MQVISSTLKKCDSYSNGPTLTLNNKARVTSEIGGIYTIIITLILLYFCWLTGSDVFLHQKPTMRNKKVHRKESSFSNLNDLEFTYRVFQKDSSGKSFEDEDKIFNISFSYYTANISDGYFSESVDYLNVSDCTDYQGILISSFDKQRCLYNLENLKINNTLINLGQSNVNKNNITRRYLNIKSLIVVIILIVIQ